MTWLLSVPVLALGLQLARAPAVAPAAQAGPVVDTQLGQRHFKLGVTLYDERDFEGARAEFRRAYAVAPSHRILFNLGQVSQELHDWVEALRYYRQYLAEGGAKIPEGRRREVERVMPELAARLAQVKLEIAGTPTQVLLDDVPVVLPADQTLSLNPGRRRLAVLYPEQPPAMRMIDVASGDRVAVSIAPLPAVVPPPLAASALQLTAGPSPERSAGVPTAAWWTWTATGMVGAAALTTGLLAQRESRTLADARARLPADPALLVWHQRRVKRYAVATDALLVGGAVLGLVSTYLSLGPRWRF